MSKRTPKHVKPDAVQPVELRSVADIESAQAVNKAIVRYKKSGNGIAAWVALAACIRHQYPIPEGLSDFFVGIADCLVELAQSGNEKGRQKAARFVLGTDVGGGASAWKQYGKLLEDEAIIERIEHEMFVHFVDPVQPSATQQEILERVAEEVDKEIKVVTELWQKHEKNAGPFRISYFQNVTRKGGIVEL